MHLMQGFRRVLHSKIHRATITHADLQYEGSITIPPALMKAADIHEYEAVHVWDLNSGSRFETYAIAGLPDSSDISVNGAAARLVAVGDLVIIASFGFLEAEQISSHTPRLVFVDAKNQMTEPRAELPGPRPSLREDPSERGS